MCHSAHDGSGPLLRYGGGKAPETRWSSARRFARRPMRASDLATSQVLADLCSSARWCRGGVNAEDRASTGEVGEGVGGDVVDDACIAHDPGACGGLAWPVPKHDKGIGRVELD
jgi:hypothetical protein